MVVLSTWYKNLLLIYVWQALPLSVVLDNLTKSQVKVRVGSVVLKSQTQKHFLFILFKLLSLFLNLKILYLLDFLLGLFSVFFELW